MDIGTALAGINWLAVVVASIVAFALGGAWYSMSVFGATWMREIGLTEEAAKKASVPRIFTSTFVLQFLAATALAACMPADSNWLTGIQWGLVVSVFWVSTAYGITYLFEQRSIRLYFINVGYYIVMFAIMGAILGAWR